MPNPLFKKLGLKDGQKIILQHFPENYFDLLIEVPEVEECEPGERADFIHWFGTELIDLRLDFPLLRDQMKEDGMIWISWPKKAAQKQTDLDYHVVKTIASNLGLVDVKVCAIDKTWTATKYVIPLKDRKQLG